MQRLTEKPWFGPKRYLGWGWSISSWQGGIVTVSFWMLLIANFIVFHHSFTGYAGALSLIGLLIGVILVTGDGPGGPTH